MTTSIPHPRFLDLDQRNISNAVFFQPFQRAVPQFAKFAIQEMFAPDKGSKGLRRFSTLLRACLSRASSPNNFRASSSYPTLSRAGLPMHTPLLDSGGIEFL